MKDQGATPIQMTLFEGKKSKTRHAGPVTCLGMTFENDDARREHFLGLLRQGLEELHAKLGGVPFTTVEDAYARMKSVEKWPMGDDARLRELAERMRHAERGKDLLQRWKDEVGFPHGEIEDILNLSDPPYYTACPNPFIADFIKHYGKPYDPNSSYKKSPFVSDVSEGKKHRLYTAHAYHTKVPHRAIMRYLHHYTDDGDLVLDFFAGSGMTGLATLLYDSHSSECGAIGLSSTHRLAVVLSELSPAATFISGQYLKHLPCDLDEVSISIVQAVEKDWGWLYETHCPKHGRTSASYYVWSDVFVCPDCSREFDFYTAAVGRNKASIKKA